MASFTAADTGRGASAGASAATRSSAGWDSSATRTDTALFVSALFLQRFTLPVQNTFLGLSLSAIGAILLYQFFRGKLLIAYDRLLWFVPFALVTTCSLLMNFNSYMITGYLQFSLFYALFMFGRVPSSEQYMRTLQAFQFLVLILSSLAIVQFGAQFVVDGKALMNFYGMVPDFLFSDPSNGIHDPRTFGHGIIKSNAFFLTEPSALSELTALGILIEVLEFRRARYLLVMALGFLMAYSGTGLVLLCFLPFAGLRHGKAALAVLLVIAFALTLTATGVIDLSAFTSRVDEFENPGTSGYARFISPFLLAARQFETVSLAQLLLGSGPGTVKYFARAGVNAWYAGGFAAEWIKILYEYGIIGSLIFIGFLAACFRKARCPGLVRAAMIFAFVFLQADMTLAIPLCTLNMAKRRRHIDEPDRYDRPLAALRGSS